ncbi:TetR/AcrR family transcriptional regulator [Streptomyces radicis]|uniref:TetR/AcrR family transcriptional regulator n=1 Tax=Streptomyces radicis TaxID=1750517 RepID=A0A3A9VYA3_9ACTN|nr:TetR/AcrR family transcriptional regulator [Streptomyces radicis]RKN05995.1 TetR/AcrR family transcriptional regulator [Streptomyces radicis]RKN17697.1 TetR/AcrR family transcriptional regulator [Streptomyces radicis]
MSQPRTSRADAARRTRARVLTAAREQMVLHGPDIGMDEIAGAAGLAVGTLYRHFPAKADLVAAVVAEYVERVADDAEAACERVTAGSRALDEITAFLGRVIEASARDRAVKAAAHALGADPGDKVAEDRASRAVATLLLAGQADGDIHPDVTVGDIYLLFATVPADQPAAARARWLALMLPGLTTHPRPTPRDRRHPVPGSRQGAGAKGET